MNANDSGYFKVREVALANSMRKVVTTVTKTTGTLATSANLCKGSLRRICTVSKGYCLVWNDLVDFQQVLAVYSTHQRLLLTQL